MSCLRRNESLWRQNCFFIAPAPVVSPLSSRGIRDGQSLIMEKSRKLLLAPCHLSSSAASSGCHIRRTVDAPRGNENRRSLARSLGGGVVLFFRSTRDGLRRTSGCTLAASVIIITPPPRRVWSRSFRCPACNCVRTSEIWRTRVVGVVCIAAVPHFHAEQARYRLGTRQTTNGLNVVYSVRWATFAYSLRSQKARTMQEMADFLYVTFENGL